MSFVAVGVTVGAGVLQAGIGAVKSGVGNARLKRLMKQRTPYTTPQEVFDMRNMAENNAQTGYDPQTLQYLTTQNDRLLSSSIGAVTRLGGDPNDISNLYDKNSMAIMKVASDNEMLKLDKFDKVYSSFATIAGEKKAEWADKESMLKDEMASQAQKVAAGNADMTSGFNMIGSGISSYLIGKAYSSTHPNQPAVAQLPANNFTPTPISSTRNFNPGLTIPPDLQRLIDAGYFNQSSQTPYGE